MAKLFQVIDGWWHTVISGPTILRTAGEKEPYNMAHIWVEDEDYQEWRRIDGASLLPPPSALRLGGLAVECNADVLQTREHEPLHGAELSA